ncbi:hypothetical protein [Limimaricola pyoseonensis]|uniref:Uncharacterized protein n=1 Tax=Limimaricola pyoseonensis TaxID=521013 RepID=A0A1G7I6K3_9RHOB|nr:hypothetical protein [Limimaricola pyoseonensis]SDF08094.1 hypothetical protein SAMN04488567_3340 [Limimaricola pyoseonensis]
MRPFLLLALPLALAACATPREACVSSALREGRVLNALIAETRGNLARGYGLEQREVLRTEREFCEYRREDGTTGRRFCDVVNTETVTEPVTLDLAQEQVKLNQLLDRRDRQQQAERAAVAQCQARYPE